jgi:hypothetical protein
MKGQFSMKLRDELDTLLDRTLGESSAEFASAVAETEKTIRDARLVETALREGDVFPDFSLPDPTGGCCEISGSVGAWSTDCFVLQGRVVPIL